MGYRNTDIKDKLQKSLGMIIESTGGTGSKPFICNIVGKKIYISTNSIIFNSIENRKNNSIDYVLIGNNSVSLALYWMSMDVLKTIYDDNKGKLITESDSKTVNQFLDKNKYNLFKINYDTEWDKLVDKIRKDLEMDTLNEQLKDLILKADAKQIICHGAPGTGKTHTIENLANTLKDSSDGDVFGKLDNIDNFVQFHPSYDYTDFVEGLRPVTINEEMNFVRMDGIFKKFCREVVRNGKPNKKYLFIIDEINRADLSKVFGELMYCFEDSKRGKTIATQYSNLPCYEVIKKSEDADVKKVQVIDDDEFADGFYIPENVVVIGTMNDIDRSVESFDFALQRRFQWIHVKADAEMTVDVLKQIISKEGDIYDEMTTDLKKQADALNELIKKTLNEDYEIGQAYFKKFAKYYNNHGGTSEPKNEEAFNQALKDVWKYSLESIISSYIRGKKLKLSDFRDKFITVKKDGTN